MEFYGRGLSISSQTGLMNSEHRNSLTIDWPTWPTRAKSPAAAAPSLAGMLEIIQPATKATVGCSSTCKGNGWQAASSSLVPMTLSFGGFRGAQTYPHHVGSKPLGSRAI